MLGKASEIKTKRVTEGNVPFDETLNYESACLGNAEILSIQSNVIEVDGYSWMGCLIIYKEPTT